MPQSNKLKIINDPIYGFINIPSEFIYDVIQHPYFQRLRRITQMGLSNLVYPGANHTRFHHALGCMHLMQKAVEVLKNKHVAIAKEEEEGLYLAILLHDIGHGPFSHAMENSIVENINHEKISLLFLHKLNQEFNGKLHIAIQIFTNSYPKKFLHQLISSQLDIDRLDYLKRDSFYSGVAEGNINSDRIIQMLNVYDDKLCIEEKGIFSIEKFIVARRIMYWQVYLHKTGVVAEEILIKIFKRAKTLLAKNISLEIDNKSLIYFLSNTINEDSFNQEKLHLFSMLDDVDIMFAIKRWQFHNDKILQLLCKIIINRDLPKITISDKKTSKETINNFKKKVAKEYNISINDASYFVFTGTLTNIAYNKNDNPIYLLRKNKQLIDCINTSDLSHINYLAKKVTKHYFVYPKKIE